MKKRVLILITALLFILIFAAFSAASAGSSEPIKCVTDITYDEYEPGIFYWYGPVSGCTLEGYVRYDPDPENPNYFVGDTLYFFELFTIYPAIGGEIYGYNAGVGLPGLPTKFRAKGWVTAASPEWEHLIGYRFYEMGIVSNPNEFPMYTEGTFMGLIPPKGQKSP